MAKASQSIAQAAQNAAFGLTVSRLSNPDVIELPESLITISSGDGSPLNVDIAEARIEFEKSIIEQCLNSYIKAHVGFLEEIAVVSYLLKFQREPFCFDSDELAKNFRWMRFPQKLDTIDSSLGQKVSPDLRSNVESINLARNVYEHRHGIVGPDDVDHKGKMTVSWLGVRMTVKKTDSEDEGTEATSLPVIVPPLHTLEMRFIPREKSFNEGEHLSFSASDISEMGFTFFNYSLKLVQAVEQTTEQQNPKRPECKEV